MPEDKPLEEIIKMVESIAEKGGSAFIKWTCPKCGERVICAEANTTYEKGYQHEERGDGTPCGGLYTGNKFGLLAISQTELKEGDKAWNEMGDRTWSESPQT